MVRAIGEVLRFQHTLEGEQVSVTGVIGGSDSLRRSTAEDNVIHVIPSFILAGGTPALLY
jgi:hypothetical protein